MNTRNSIVALGIDHLAFKGKGYVFSLSEKNSYETKIRL